MKLLKTLFSVGAMSVVLFTGIFNTSEVKANQAQVKCFNVSSKQGWQHFDLGGHYDHIASVEGNWTVDYRRYAGVGPKGHNEPGLEPYKQYKYDQNFPFGALFVEIPTDSHGYVWVRGYQKLPKPITRTAIRINDSNIALGDNSGVLRVCFTR
ncbi:MAG: hypothetical protein AN482_09560 [Anabaena sp. LE011-02]|nr:MAG: hypothetical protein AN482_09560 [Anabaena sp. LE011-02]